MSKPNCIAKTCKRVASSRGLCRACYESARRQVSLGNRAWGELEDLGLVLPVDRRPSRNPFLRALEDLEGGGS